eukprot:gene17975-biopygen10717
MQSTWEAPEPAEHARTAGKVGGDAECRDGSAKIAKVVGDEAGCEGDGICGTSQKTPEAVEACTGLRTMSEAWEGIGGCRRQGCRRDTKEDCRRTVEDADDAEEAEIVYGDARPQKTTEAQGRNSSHDEFIPRSGRCGRRRMVAQGHGRPWKSVEGEVSVRNSFHTMESVEGAECIARAPEGGGDRSGMNNEGQGISWRPKEEGTEDVGGAEYAAHTEYAEDRVWSRKAAESSRRQGKAAGEHGRCWRRWQGWKAQDAWEGRGRRQATVEG